MQIVALRLAPLQEPLDYRSGQYVVLTDAQGIVAPRSFSIANAPRQDGLLSLLVSIVPGGEAGDWIGRRLRPGDEVLVSSPYGRFVADGRPGPVLYLGGGSGLAPLLALIEEGLAAGDHRRRTLLLSARTEREALFRSYLERLQRQHTGFRFHRSLTRAEGPPPVGRIPTVLPLLMAGLGRHSVHIAGSPGLVEASEGAVKALGAAADRIHSEPFLYEPKPW